MKKYYFWICVLLGATGYAQNTAATALNTNGFPIATQESHSTSVATLANPSELSYSDLRELSEISTPNGYGYPWISGDGLRLYYIGNMASQIFYTERPDVDSMFGTSTLVMTELPITPISVWLSNDELDAYVTSSTALIYRMHRNAISEPFGAPVQQSTNGDWDFFSGLSLSPDQNEMYAFVTLPDRIVRLARTGENAFEVSGLIAISAGTNVNPGILSKDGLHFILPATTENNTFTALNLVSRETTSDMFDGTTAELIGGLFDAAPNLTESQPTVSDNMEWLCFTRNYSGGWPSNKLYIARNTALSVAETRSNDSKFSVFPNPTGGLIHLKFDAEIEGGGLVEIINSIGQTIQTMPIADKIDLSAFPPGIFFVKVTTTSFTETKKIIRR